MSPESQANSPIPKDGILRARFELNLPPQTPVLLNDINGLLKPGISSEDVDQAVKILIGTTYKTENVIYAVAQSFRDSLSNLVASTLADALSKNTAILWPGDGAKSVLRETLRDLPQLKTFRSFFIPTVRIVENGKVTDVTVDSTELKNDVATPYQTFLIIDDVVASGTTLNRIREAAVRVFGNNKLFRAVTWFLRKPTDVNGYESVNSVYQYSTTEGWPALNSLSTLLRTDAKGEAVREGYIKKYIRYPYGFRKQIDYIRSLTTTGGSP